MQMLNNLSAIVIGTCFMALGTLSSASAATISLTVNVPGMSDPWLAGMPEGSTASEYAGRPPSVVPPQAPVLVSGLTLQAGAILTFNVSGSVSHRPIPPVDTPDGGDRNVSHRTGAENGISNIFAPITSLVGVFLGPEIPNLSPAPNSLNFGAPASRDYLSITPLLKQVFFIGDGLTSGNVLQQAIVPEGATRFYLGTMDTYEWPNNGGSFTVKVTEESEDVAVPEPTTLLGSLLGLGFLGMRTYRKRRQHQHPHSS